MSIFIGGQRYEVPGAPRTLERDGEPWARLDRGQARVHTLQAGIIHKTQADDPERIIDSPSPPTQRWGTAQDTVRYWQERDPDNDGDADPVSGTHFVCGYDGSIVQTEDPVTFNGWHAHAANALAWGVEIKEYGRSNAKDPTTGGRVEARAMRSCVALTLLMTSVCRIQRQIPHAYRDGRALERWRQGSPYGADLVGIFGHRDSAWSSKGGVERDRNDPGDAIFEMLAAEGFERFDFPARQDIDVWSARQMWLAKEGYYDGRIDGIAGPKTCAAIEAAGFPGGIYTRWRELPEKLPLVADVA